MDIRGSYTHFRQAVQAFIKENPRALDISRPNPYQLHNKAYRDTMVSANIFRKSLQLYNDVINTQAQAEKAASGTRDYLAEIKEKGLSEVLRAHVKTDIGGLGEKLRGGAVDKRE